MGKLIKVVVLLAIAVGAIALIVHYTSNKPNTQTTVSPTPAGKQDTQAKKEKPELQEKYGFAPSGGGD